MKPIEIGDYRLNIPLIQGGMGIGVSRCSLAGAVAKEGGMGVISAAQVGYDHPDFRSRPEESNLLELPNQIRKAKKIAQGCGMVAVNLMAVTQLYKEYVECICEAGADAIVTGAGLPTSLPEYTHGFDTKIAPIVSTAKAMQVILKYWDRKYSRTADFLVVEGPKAGGHLRFSFEILAQLSSYDFDAEVRAIVAAKRVFEEKYQRRIPVFLAGGISDAQDVRHALSLGTDGVQVATRFVATEECDASDKYKEAYIQAKEEDVTIIHSPVGMPGRALRNAFVERMQAGQEKIVGCYNCLKACNPKTAPYCISQALINAVRGDLDDGLIFCGARVGEVNRMTTVKNVIRDLAPGWA